MKVTKEELIIAIKGNISCYGGEYGPVDWSLIETTESFKANHTEGVFGIKGNTQYIFFEGSAGKKDWWDNFHFCKSPVKSISNSKKSVPYANVNPDIKVHDGFISQYKTVRDIILAHVCDKKVQGFNRIIITGHSLGATLATLCAVDIQFNNPDLEIICLPFASPRVGNKAFVKSYNKRVPETYRFTFENDIVCRVPMESFGYKHVDKDIFLGDKPKWYDRILSPFVRNIGSTDNHYPQNYLKAVEKLKW